MATVKNPDGTFTVGEVVEKTKAETTEVKAELKPKKKTKKK